MTIKITPYDGSSSIGGAIGKLADVELHFSDGPLAGLKLIGFAVWERRTGNGRNVTFPARSYVINGDRRSFALLRPIGADAGGQTNLRDLILQAYADFEAEQQDEQEQPRPTPTRTPTTQASRPTPPATAPDGLF